MSKLLTILCDLDGVCYNFMDEVLARYNRDYNDNMTTKDVTDYNMHTVVKKECGFKIYDYFHEEGLFLGQPLDGAVDGVQVLRSMGHDLLFCTKPVDYSYFCMAEKQQWVDRHFPNIGAGGVIFATKKHMVRGDVLIDDSPFNLTDFPGHRILVDAPWNQEFEAEEYDVERAYGWDDIIRVVRKLSLDKN